MCATRGWVCYLNKATERLRENGLATEGTLHELRRRLSQFALEHPEKFREDTDMEEKDEPTAEGTDVAGQRKAVKSNVKMRMPFRWKGCIRFFGANRAALGELGLSNSQMMHGLPELLRGDALLWYRNRRIAWTS